MPFSLLLDTGAEAGLVSPAVVQSLGLPLARGASARVVGNGVEAPSLPIAVLRRLAFGRLVVPDVPVPVGALPQMPIMTPPVAGLLGADLLHHFEVEVDVGGGTLRLYDPAGLRGPCRALPPWEGAFSTIPITRVGDRVVLPALLDGHKITALLDSGARSRIVSRAAALAAGVPAATLDREPGGLSRALGAPELTYHWHRFRSLTIGGETVRDPVLTVVPIGDPVDMLLGADWFARHRVWISYATGNLFVQKRS